MHEWDAMIHSVTPCQSPPVSQDIEIYRAAIQMVAQWGYTDTQSIAVAVEVARKVWVAVRGE